LLAEVHHVRIIIVAIERVHRAADLAEGLVFSKLFGREDALADRGAADAESELREAHA
jgi:hypothetical protein